MLLCNIKREQRIETEKRREHEGRAPCREQSHFPLLFHLFSSSSLFLLPSSFALASSSLIIASTKNSPAL